MEVEERVSTKGYDRRLVGRLLALALPWWRPVLVATACLLVGSLLQVVTPLLTRVAIDRYIAPKMNSSTSTSPKMVTSPEVNISFSASASVVTRVTSRPTGERS